MARVHQILRKYIVDVELPTVKIGGRVKVLRAHLAQIRVFDLCRALASAKICMNELDLKELR